MPQSNPAASSTLNCLSSSPGPGPSAPAEALAGRIGTVGENLSNSLRGIIETIPGGRRRPQQLARALRLNKDLSSRLLTATQADPLAAMHRMPSPRLLLRFLDAAQKHGASSDLVAEARELVDDFRVLIEDVAGSRAALDAIIGEWLPEAYDKMIAGARQTHFRASASLKGVKARATVTTFVIRRIDGSEMCDTLVLTGLLGLQRLRPTAPVRLTSIQHRDAHQARSLTGGPLDRSPGLFLPEFCHPSIPEFDLAHAGDHANITLRCWQGVGPGAAVDLFMAEHHPAAYRFDFERSTPRFFYANVEQPTEWLVLDLFLDPTVWPDAEPEIRVYDTSTRGVADPTDPSRDIDLLDANTVSASRLGVEHAAWRNPDVSSYLSTLTSAADTIGWDLAGFHGYRCRLQYPMYGSQVCMTLRPIESR